MIAASVHPFIGHEGIESYPTQYWDNHDKMVDNYTLRLKLVGDESVDLCTSD